MQLIPDGSAALQQSEKKGPVMCAVTIDAETSKFEKFVTTDSNGQQEKDEKRG